MKLENLKQEFPPMPEDIRTMIAQTVAQQVAAPTYKTKKHTAGKTALLILAAALALSGTALAASSHSGFYNLFFGTQPVTAQSAEESESVTVPASDHTTYDAEKDVEIQFTLPGYELVAVDEEEADRLLGAYTQEIGDSCTLDGYTVTILGYIQDELGTYRLYYSIENPDGLDNISYYDNNGYTSIASVDLDGFRVVTDGSMAYADTARSTDTKVYVCVPGTVSLWSSGASLTVIPAVWTPGQGGQINLTAESDDLVPATTAESGNYTVSLSPMGLRVAQMTPYENNMGFEMIYAVITFSDGTEYVVVDQNINNTSYRCVALDDQYRNTVELACFNRLIDPEQVVSVTIRGIIDEAATTIYFS